MQTACSRPLKCPQHVDAPTRRSTPISWCRWMRPARRSRRYSRLPMAGHCWTCEDAAALSTHPLLLSARSLLIVARPAQLRNRTLLDLSSSLPTAMGILTARDVPGVSFAIAKALAGRRDRPVSSGHLDAIARRQWLRQPEAEAETGTELDAAATWQVLNHGEWDTLSIHCHGDGPTRTSTRSPLCVADSEERAFDGHRAGCALDADTPRCKRVHGPERRPVRFGDLRARRMCLFTCNGFSGGRRRLPVGCQLRPLGCGRVSCRGSHDRLPTSV